MIGVFNIRPKINIIKGYENHYTFFQRLLEILFWIWFLNLAIGFINLLPIWITDGGQIFLTICQKYFSKNTANTIYTIVSFISLGLIVLTLFPNILF